MTTEVDYAIVSLKDLAAIVSKKLSEHQIDSTLVGGACVSIYSSNRYQSYDLDYVTYEGIRTITVALNELGFIRDGRYFRHPKCQFFIDFVSPPVAIGNEPIHHFEKHQTPLGVIQMLTPTDSVKDRLAGFYHWNDLQAFDQAATLYDEIPDKINLNEIKRWSKQEGHLDKFDEFIQKIRYKKR